MFHSQDMARMSLVIVAASLAALASHGSGEPPLSMAFPVPAAPPGEVLNYLMHGPWPLPASAEIIQKRDELWDRIRSAPDLYAAEIERRVELPATYEEAARLSSDELRKIATTSVNTLWYLRFVGRDFAEPVLRRVHDKSSALAEAAWDHFAPLAPPEVLHAVPPGTTREEWNARIEALYERVAQFTNLAWRCVELAGELDSPIFVDDCLRSLEQAGHERLRYSPRTGFVQYAAKFAHQRPDVLPRLLLVKNRWKDYPLRDWHVDEMLEEIDRAAEAIGRPRRP